MWIDLTWLPHDIHNSTPFTDGDFADKSIDLAGNKCRNPSRSQSRLWCFIQQQGQIVKDLCHVDACGKNTVNPIMISFMSNNPLFTTFLTNDNIYNNFDIYKDDNLNNNHNI